MFLFIPTDLVEKIDWTKKGIFGLVEDCTQSITLNLFISLDKKTSEVAYTLFLIVCKNTILLATNVSEAYRIVNLYPSLSIGERTATIFRNLGDKVIVVTQHIRR